MNLGQHISQQYDEDLEHMRNQVLAMGGLVEQQVSDALRALLESDRSLAEQVINNDLKVNGMEVALDEKCTLLLVRRQPAATDLRLVISVIKTITDLERIGDEAERIARMATHFSEMGGGGRHVGRIEHLGDMVRSMLHDALDVFARMDPELAVAVWKRDRKVDAEYESVMRQLMTFMMESPRVIPRVIDVMWSSRALERIGDRSRNICEYVIYLVKGKDVRHTSLDQPEHSTRQDDDRDDDSQDL